VVVYLLSRLTKNWMAINQWQGARCLAGFHCKAVLGAGVILAR
jgi:hypothetical protein